MDIVSSVVIVCSVFSLSNKRQVFKSLAQRCVGSSHPSGQTHDSPPNCENIAPFPAHATTSHWKPYSWRPNKQDTSRICPVICPLHPLWNSFTMTLDDSNTGPALEPSSHTSSTSRTSQPPLVCSSRFVDDDPL